jgi:hypothetical protein
METPLLHVGPWLLSETEINSVDLSRLEDHRVKVRHQHLIVTVLEGQQALDFVMRVCPSALEGRGLRFARHAWAFHNLVAHPLLQVLTWLGLKTLGMVVHDRTIPKPRKVSL